MTEKYGAYYKLIGILTDLSLINMCGYIAYLITFWPLDIHSNHINFVQILLINFIWFNVTQITRLYKDIFAKDAIPTIRQSLFSLLLFIVFITSLFFLVPEFSISDRLILNLFLLFCPVFLGAKVIFLLLRRSHRERLIEYTRVVIVGAGAVGVELARIMESKSNMGYRVVGFFDDKPHLAAGNVEIIGAVNECLDYVKRLEIKEIYCTLPDQAIDKIQRLMRDADKEMVRFKLVPDVKNFFNKNVNVHMLGHFPVISSRAEPLENVNNKMFKRIFDICFSVVVIVFVLSWLIPLIALLIKMETKGPVFFKQQRSGKNNLPFFCLKFRSMSINSEAHIKQATKFDSRITKVGAFIRKTSIDELPQFFNVLAGNMSVVGPRPHMLQHTEQYSAIIDKFMVRHLLLPGITGWAQVNGLRGETNLEGEMEKRVEADIWYLENWSMLLDLRIAFLTVWQIFTKNDKAY